MVPNCADNAGTLYDKIRGFVEDLEKLGTQLSTVNKTYMIKGSTIEISS
jgi:DNA anti-recombination protein RmuC